MTKNKIHQNFKDFFESEKSGGLLLVAATFFSLFLANSALQVKYLQIFQTEYLGHNAIHWINEGLMAIFFLLIGLELKGEFRNGELSDPKNSALPIMAALGGMIIPACIYFFINRNTITQSGAGIPMATDIAFAIGVISLLGKKVPTSLKLFLTTLAVIDDLGAILVIAIFYTSTISLKHLLISLGIWGILWVLKKMNVKSLIVYLIGGLAMWFYMLDSGIHATISGVLLSLVIPTDDEEKKSTSALLQKKLHFPVAFVILPIFALANTGISIDSNCWNSLKENFSIGIILGLLMGKPLGIFLFSWLGTILKVCKLPTSVNWKHIIGVGFLGGIGFTMSIFITLLAFDSNAIIAGSKIAILLASFTSAIVGFTLLRSNLK